MATEQGVVVKLGRQTAWVKTTRSSACNTCASKGACQTHNSGKEMEVEALNSPSAKIGDNVVISIKTSSLLKMSFLLYVFPILCMIVGAAIGLEIAHILSVDSSVCSAIVGLSFFVLAFAVIKTTGNKMASKNAYRPKIIKILGNHLSSSPT